MGFLDILRGKPKVKGPAPDRLFAMSTAYVTMEAELGMKPTGRAAIVFQPIATTDFDAIVADMEEVLGATGTETGTKIEKTDDSFGYRWMILTDEDFEDLVVGLNAVNSALQDGGYGERVLAALFSLKDSSGRPVYFIYNMKRGTFYPFVPQPGSAQARDNEAELRLKAQLDKELPIEPELERWFPLWGVPV
jgi:hypothetical protein